MIRSLGSGFFFPPYPLCLDILKFSQIGHIRESTCCISVFSVLSSKVLAQATLQMFTHCVCHVTFSWQTCWCCKTVNVLWGLYLRCYPSGEYSMLWAVQLEASLKYGLFICDVSSPVSECCWHKKHSCSSFVVQLWHNSTQSNFWSTHVMCRKLSCSLHLKYKALLRHTR